MRDGTARDCSGDGDGAVRCILFHREDLARHLGILDGEFGPRGVEVADPEFRHEAEGCGMHHAAVGGDGAGAADLLAQPRRDREITAQQDYEARHGAFLANAACKRIRADIDLSLLSTGCQTTG